MRKALVVLPITIALLLGGYFGAQALTADLNDQDGRVVIVTTSTDADGIARTTTCREQETGNRGSVQVTCTVDPPLLVATTP